MTIKTDYTIKTEESRLAVFKQKLNASKEDKAKNFTKNASRWRKFFKGEHFGNLANTKSDLIVVNYIYSILKAIIPQTYYQDPYFNVYINNPEITDETIVDDFFLEALSMREELTEDALNEVWREIRAKYTNKRIQLDQLIMGFGAGKLGWSFITEQTKPTMETGQEFTELVKEDKPFFLRISTDDIFFDVEANHFDEQRHLVTRYFLPSEMVEKRFNIEGGLNPDSVLSKDLSLKYTKGKKIFDKVEIYEWQDIISNKFYYFTDGYDKFLNIADNKYDFGFNTKLFWVNDCPDELYPISDVSQLEDLNLELDKTRTQLLNHRKKIQRKILAETGSFKTQEEFNKFMNDEDMQVCEVKSGALSNTNGRMIEIVQPSIVPVEFYHIDEINKDDIYQVSGVGANQLSSEGLVAKTATEANIIATNANLRNKERVDRMEDYCENVARCLLSMMQKFQTKNITFYNRDKKVWRTYNNEDIKGDYSVSIKLGSMQRPDDQIQTEMLINVMPKFLEAVDPATGQPVLNIKEVFKSIMKKAGFSETEIMKMTDSQESMPTQQGLQPGADVMQTQPGASGMGTGMPPGDIMNLLMQAGIR